MVVAMLVPCSLMPARYTLCEMCRVGRNRIYIPYMTVCMVISLPKTPYVHRIYV